MSGAFVADQRLFNELSIGMEEARLALRRRSLDQGAGFGVGGGMHGEAELTRDAGSGACGSVLCETFPQTDNRCSVRN